MNHKEAVVKNWKMVLLVMMVAMIGTSAFAAEAGAPMEVKWGVVSAAFVLGISAAAGAMGQSRAIAAACEGIARNPGAAGAIRLAMIIGLALIESLVIYALIIAFMIRNI